MNAESSGGESAESSSDIKAWVVRAGREGETVAHNLEENVVTIEWDEFDVPELDRFSDRASYGSYIEERFRHSTRGERQSARDQIWRFYHHISVGDLVVVPLKNYGNDDDWVAIGRVLGEASRDDSQPPLAKKRRPVEWLAWAVPKSGVVSDLRKSVDGPGTVRPIKSEQAPQRLLHLAEHGNDPGPTVGRLVTPPKPVVRHALSGDEAGVVAPDGKVVEGASKWVRVLTYEKDRKARERWASSTGGCK